MMKEGKQGRPALRALGALALLLATGAVSAPAVDAAYPFPSRDRAPSVEALSEPQATARHPWFSTPYFNLFAIGGSSLFLIATLIGLYGVFGERTPGSTRERPRRALGRLPRWRRRTDVLQTFVESSPVGLGIWDAEGNPVRANAAIARALGLPEDETSRQPLSEVRPRVWQRIQSQLPHAGQNAAIALEITGEFARDYLFQMYPLRDREEKLIAIGVTAAPAPAIRAEWEARTLRAQGDREEMARILYSVAHDLREPLRTAMVSLQVLRGARKDWSTGTLEIFDRVLNALRGMSQLVDSLLSFSRAGHREPALAEVELDDIVDTACAQLRAAIAEKRAVIRRGWLPRVRVDRTQMVRVLQNLIGNALKFQRGDEPPVIEIVAMTHAEGCEISIRDNGVGLGSADLERVFEPFQRAANSAKLPGSGIGLATCKRIIERHGGRIWASHNANGRGATFRFTLPPLGEKD